MSYIWQADELTCKPLDTFSDIQNFLQNPPAWRSLCIELEQHSKRLIRNIEINKHLGVSRTFIDGPESFCHFDPDADELERHDERKLPKTLVCHDMANGYHDDSNIDGTGNYDAYTFYNWAGIDIFCYFSHHLITIPPLGWINIGHKHGVKVIGTVITEWAEGITQWDKILASESEYKTFASALVAIAKTLKFDGWLLNVENKIAKPEVLLAFVKHLHTTLHQELHEPVLIWYDSVTVDGHLNWQNALNHKNKVFFDACDGFFTNYSWTEEDIITSVQNAGDRLTDLFIGIDVWGRNFFGGGQFNIQEAVEVAHSHGCSLAIFAPAWTHEAMTMDKSDLNRVAMSENLEKYEHFLLRDRALWDSIWRYLNTRVPCALPFKSSFCRGQGLKRRLYGEVLCPVPWYNLRHQQYQPNSSHGTHAYFLSTMDHILQASRTGILRDSQGIIKYRDAIQMSKFELEAIPSQEHQGIIPKADSLGAIEEGPVAPDVEDNSEEGPDQNPKLSMKRKMKNVFKHIFRSKSLRKDDNHEAESEEILKSENVDMKSKTHKKSQNENETGHKLFEIKEKTINAQNHDSKMDFNKLAVIPEQNSELDIQAYSEEVGQSLISFDPNDKTEIPVETQNFKPEQNVSKRDAIEHDVETTQQTFNSGELNEEENDVDAVSRMRIKKDRSMVQMSINIKLKNSSEKTRYGLAYVPDEAQCLEVYFEDSFIGGSCLMVNPSDPHTREHRLIRVFHCDFECEESLIVCVVTKNLVGYEDQFLNLKFFMVDENGEVIRVVLVGRNMPQVHHSEKNTTCIINLSPVNVLSDKEFREVQKYILLNEPGFYIPIENSFKWSVRYYEINMPRSRVTSINCDTGLAEGPILLGHLGICSRLKNSENV